MANFRVNDTVRVKATDKVGVIKGRDVHELPDGKVRVEYIVKLGNGIENWASFTRNEIEKVVKEEREAKHEYKYYTELANGYKLTMYAVVKNKDFDEKMENEWKYREGKELRIGYSLCSPEDTFDIKVGEKIAKHRAKHRPFTRIISHFHGEFNASTVTALMLAKAKYICNNLDNFIKKEN